MGCLQLPDLNELQHLGLRLHRLTVMYSLELGSNLRIRSARPRKSIGSHIDWRSLLGYKAGMTTIYEPQVPHNGHIYFTMAIKNVNAVIIVDYRRFVLRTPQLLRFMASKMLFLRFNLYEFTLFSMWSTALTQAPLPPKETRPFGAKLITKPEILATFECHLFSSLTLRMVGVGRHL